MIMTTLLQALGTDEATSTTNGVPFVQARSVAWQPLWTPLLYMLATVISSPLCPPLTDMAPQERAEAARQAEATSQEQGVDLGQERAQEEAGKVSQPLQQLCQVDTFSLSLSLFALFRREVRRDSKYTGRKRRPRF